MNIYHCWRDFGGMGLNAVVAAESVEAAKDELMWELDEDTHKITITKIAVAEIDQKQTTFSEEYL